MTYDGKAKMRLLDKRRITEKGCWEFTGALSSDGYGSIRYKGKVIGAHILSFILFKPESYVTYLQVCHKCNNRKCFNPEHLYQGTQSDNSKDAVRDGTHNMARKLFCPRGHEYNEKNTYINPNRGRRSCRECCKIHDNFRSLFGG